ncbi:MAG: LptF/LptG family permease [Myxococcota bacterium]
MRLLPWFGTLTRSVIREIALYSVIAFAGILLILLSQNALRQLEPLVRVGFRWNEWMLALRSIAVMFMAYALPIAFLLGSLFAVRRMKSDAELLAMQSCGVGIGVLLSATLSVGTLVAAATAWLVIDAEHVARRDMRSLLMNVTARGNILEPGRFLRFNDRVVYVEERFRDNVLRGVMIASDAEDDLGYVIFADRGAFHFDSERDMLRIELDRGDLHIDAGDWRSGRTRRIAFEHLDYEIDIAHLLAHAYTPTRPKQMSLTELEDVRARAARGEALWDLDEKDPSRYAIEAQRRLALPVAPLIFAVLAVALGASGRRTSRSGAMLLGVALAFGYYAALSFGGLLSERGWLPPWAVVWGTTGLFAVGAAAALVRARRNFGP